MSARGCLWVIEVAVAAFLLTTLADTANRSHNDRMDLSATDASIGLLFASAILWAPIFMFAYHRRQFGGTARNYFLAFVGTWFATVAFFVLLTMWENR